MLSGGAGAEGLRRGAGARGRKPPLRTCGRPFSILINANNELFSVWLGADPPRRTAPRATTTWSRVQLYKRDRFQPPSNPRPAISYGLSLSLSGLATTSGGNRSRQPTARSRDPADRQSSSAFDSDEGEPRYRFRWGTCPSFFSLHRALPLSWLSAIPRSVPRATGSDLALSLPLFLALSLCDELAELTGCEPVVQKRANI